jgi:mRNA-degrading endonuclease RelE of RelBE toxin-antitoxin system
MVQFIILPHFLRQLKPLKKKYRHLKEAVIIALESFDAKKNVSLGHNVYKIRFRSADLPRGKSKSFRLIIFVVEREKCAVPIAIYFKGDKTDITPKEINDHLELILFEARAQNLLT